MTQETEKKAVIYTRVASGADAERADRHAAQQARCHEYARAKGYEVAATFEDNASGNSVDRPGMKAMLMYLEQHRTDPHVVLIDEVSRLARSLSTHGKLRAAIHQASALLECPAFEFDENAVSQLREHVLVAATTLKQMEIEHGD